MIIVVVCCCCFLQSLLGAAFEMILLTPPMLCAVPLDVTRFVAANVNVMLLLVFPLYCCSWLLFTVRTVLLLFRLFPTDIAIHAVLTSL